MIFLIYWYTNSCTLPGFDSESFSMYCITKVVYRNGASAYIFIWWDSGILSSQSATSVSIQLIWRYCNSNASFISPNVHCLPSIFYKSKSHKIFQICTKMTDLCIFNFRVFYSHIPYFILYVLFTRTSPLWTSLQLHLTLKAHVKGTDYGTLMSHIIFSQRLRQSASFLRIKCNYIPPLYQEQ